ncbi:winged helix-turn-helix domain-containing protein [Actinoplanes sp. NPDC049316]|uniref:winged helix-turn-helix domain-containing protein n=1 Tax=Actinoplanes sp. NPDC049316 TaxID=3154727 RepID=UPI00342BD820
MPITPSYQRIVDDIKSKIASGELSPGDQLPSARGLQEQYGVGSTAVRNAMLVLRAEGLVEGHQGKGVYVAARPAVSEG